MRELKELRRRIIELKENVEEQKKLIEKLRKEKRIMGEKYDFLLNKLNEIVEVYEEAGKKILEMSEDKASAMRKEIEDLRLRIEEKEKVARKAMDEIWKLCSEGEKK